MFGGATVNRTDGSAQFIADTWLLHLDTLEWQPVETSADLAATPRNGLTITPLPVHRVGNRLQQKLVLIGGGCLAPQVCYYGDCWQAVLSSPLERSSKAKIVALLVSCALQDRELLPVEVWIEIIDLIALPN